MRALTIVLFALAALTPAGALAADDRLAGLIESVSPDIIQKRHVIHQNPELGNREFKTSALVAEHLRSLGLEVETGIAHTGVIGVLRGGRPGPTIAVRADMDALPVTEETDLPFRSTVRTEYLGQEVGVMHACGHDIHTSVQLGVASVLAAMREEIPGTIVFIFQPAEEGTPMDEEGGAKMMVAEGVLTKHGPEAIFGLHSDADHEVGEASFTIGPAMAAVDHFYITIHGKQSHGARPEESVDPVVMASEFVLAAQTIRSRNLPPLTPSVVTVGILRSGTRYNIIPDTAYMEGTVRTYDESVQDAIEERMRTILEGVTHTHGGSFDLEYERYTPATVNDADLARESIPSLQRVLGADKVFEEPPVMGGEDFAYFAREIPGFYFFLGTREPGGESGGAHTPTFRAVDEAVPTGMRVMTAVLLDYLERHAG